MKELLKKIWNASKTHLMFMDPRINYCGTYERQAFFTKWIPLQNFLPGINKGCFFHDTRYSMIFNEDQDQRRSILRLLFLKFIVDVIFLFEMLKFSFKNTKNPLKWSGKILISVLFFLIVLIATPYYAWIFAKRQNSSN